MEEICGRKPTEPHAPTEGRKQGIAILGSRK